MGDLWTRSQIHKANEFSFEKGFQWDPEGYKTFLRGGVFRDSLGWQLAYCTDEQSESQNLKVIWPNPAPILCFLRALQCASMVQELRELRPVAELGVCDVT